MTVALLLPQQRDTVDSNTVRMAVIHNNKPLLPAKRIRNRQLPSRARFMQRNINRKALRNRTTITNKKTSTASVVVVKHRPSILNKLKCSYSRRGSTSGCECNNNNDDDNNSKRITCSLQQLPCSPPSPMEKEEQEPTNHKEVTSGSLAGAKRSYVDLLDHGCETGENDISDADGDDRSTLFTRFSPPSEDEGDNSCVSPENRNRGRLVRFSPQCLVVEIPHFRDYSQEQKQNLWSNRRQIRQMARKNTAEYQFDGWDLESATEERDFVTVAGVAVHPAHLEEL